MDKLVIEKLLYNTPVWIVFSYILQNPEKPVRGASLVKAIPTLSKTAIYDAIQDLSKRGVLIREEDAAAYELNQSLAWIRSIMMTDSLIRIQPLVNELTQISSRIVLFGSRARGDYTSTSDYDLLVVSSNEDVLKVVMKSKLEESVQLILKTPEEWIDLHQTDPELYESIQKGIVLWERK